MDDHIPKKYKPLSQELLSTIILFGRPEKVDLEPSKYIDNMCHYALGNSTSEKYVIKISRFDSGTPEEWILFVDLV